MNTQSLRSFALLAVLLVGAAALPSALAAQRDSSIDVALVAPTPAVVVVAPVVSVTPALAGPRIVSSGISKPISADGRALAPRQDSMGNGNNVAMMVVGGAGIIVGSLVGGDAGYTIAVGGAIVGLIGLFRYLR